MREDLRFAIPWKSPEEVVERLRALAVPGGDAVAVYADDGEKFGGWPGTFEHVHERGWLRRFLDLLEANADCLRLGTLGELRDRLAPRGTVYLPDGSYREMTEWALPAEAQEAYGDLRATLERDGIAARVGRFLKGGTWRGFLGKYPEAAAMHAKMQNVSAKVAEMGEVGPDVDRAQTALYRGQCNCAYWHGVFGGVYLPHLRSAVYANLIEAEALADAASHDGVAWAEARVVDIDLDGREDVVLATDAVWLAADPARGGMLMECDARAARVNLLAGMTRRPESYHRDARVEAPDLRPLLQYDTYRRGALLDHFLAPEAAENDPDDASRFEWGDFVAEPYTAMVVETGPDRAAARLVRDGVVQQRGMQLRVSVTKELRVTAGSGDVQVAYGIANASNAVLETLFAVEFGFALLAGDGPDRYIEVEGRRLGLGSPTAWTGETDALTVADTWRKLCCTLRADTPVRFGSYPLLTVSRSQGGYETTYQSTVVLAALPLNLSPGARADLNLILELGSA
jgi:alpha-amylase